LDAADAAGIGVWQWSAATQNRKSVIKNFMRCDESGRKIPQSTRNYEEVVACQV
jgi:hypothetical protein